MELGVGKKWDKKNITSKEFCCLDKRRNGKVLPFWDSLLILRGYQMAGGDSSHHEPAKECENEHDPFSFSLIQLLSLEKQRVKNVERKDSRK